MTQKYQDTPVAKHKNNIK